MPFELDEGDEIRRRLFPIGTGLGDSRTGPSAWLYNDVGTPNKPGDLGYWVGYRITRAYDDKAANKRAALRTLVDLEDPTAILNVSGWQPGL